MVKSIEFIETIICAEKGIEPEKLHDSAKYEPFCTIRQMVMYFAVKEGHTNLEAGKYFGRDHATVINAVRSIQNRFDTDRRFNSEIKHFAELLKDEEVWSRFTSVKLNEELMRLEMRRIELQKKLEVA